MLGVICLDFLSLYRWTKTINRINCYITVKHSVRKLVLLFTGLVFDQFCRCSSCLKTNGMLLFIFFLEKIWDKVILFSNLSFFSDIIGLTYQLEMLKRARRSSSRNVPSAILWKLVVNTKLVPIWTDCLAERPVRQQASVTQRLTRGKVSQWDFSSLNKGEIECVFMPETCHHYGFNKQLLLVEYV